MTPSDRNSARALTRKLLDHDSPSYTRTARNKTSEIYTEEAAESLEIGKASVLRGRGCHDHRMWRHGREGARGQEQLA